MFASEMLQCSLKAIVDRKGNLEEFESVGGNVVKSRFLLVLDQSFEGADRLGGANFDWKYVTGIIAEN